LYRLQAGFAQQVDFVGNPAALGANGQGHRLSARGRGG
jgi:hypothetical protein